MDSELEQTIRRLVGAERKALRISRSDINVHEPNDLALDGAHQADNPSSEYVNVKLERNQEANQFSVHFEEYLWDKLRLLKSFNPKENKTEELAREIWENDVPEAERLGLYHLRSALEDAAFKVLNPEEYSSVHRELFVNKSVRQSFISDIVKNLKIDLDKHHVPFTTIQHRIKHAAGVWRKMNEKGLQLNQIYDLMAIRIIVPDENTCYLALNVVHQMFEPRLLRFKDYISDPKKNGYRSIHTSVKYNDDIDFEVQIRSVKMHEQSEQGTASHWKYKQSTNLNIPRKKWFSLWNPMGVKRLNNEI